MIKIRPIFKWAGGKYNCIEKIVSSLPPGQRLIEPFAGAATVFFNTNYPQYLLGEQNADLVLFYTMLTQEQDKFIKLCKSYFLPEFNCTHIYYELRHQFNHCDKELERAAIFLYLNRHGYNGLCRYNQSGLYNVPFGHHSKVYFPEISMRHLLQRLNGLEITCSDFRDTFTKARSGDIVYCDPPYVPATESQKSFNYHKDGFTLQDQQDLAQLARETARRGIPVILSNHDTFFTREQYQDAEIFSFPVKRAISCKVESRNPVHELLAIFHPPGDFP